jgi:F-type H+-transporting ATPase subunit gamma
MANLKKIKKRIENISVIEKITNSMKAISTARLSSIKLIKNNANDFYKSSIAVMNNLYHVYKDVSGANINLFNCLYGKDNANLKTLIIFIAGDKGLCGAYNNNIFKAVNKLIQADENSVVLPIGLKAISFANKLDKSRVIENKMSSDLQKISNDDVLLLSYNLINLVKNGSVTKLKIISTYSKSIFQQEVLITDLLPFITKEEEDKNNYVDSDYLNLANTIDKYLINYFTFNIFDKLVDSLVSEYYSRLNAMDGANENSRDLQKKLKLEYNRTRQALITKELIEIVSGAEAL